MKMETLMTVAMVVGSLILGAVVKTVEALLNTSKVDWILILTIVNALGYWQLSKEVSRFHMQFLEHTNFFEERRKREKKEEEEQLALDREIYGDEAVDEYLNTNRASSAALSHNSERTKL
jgi:hypothetical protein